MKKIRFTETILRDAHQSLIATRLSTKEMLPVLNSLIVQAIIHLRCGVEQLLTLA